MNRRGISFAIDILPDLFLLFALFASVVMNANLGQVSAPDTLPYQTVMITNRLLHSPNGISYIDPVTRRVYPHIIDATKFGEEELEEHLYYGSVRQGNDHYAAKITLEDEVMYYNKDRYERWRPMAETPVFGGREKSVRDVSTPVLIRQGESLIPGTLNVEVVARP